MKTLLTAFALLIALLPAAAGAQTADDPLMRTVERDGWKITFSDTWFSATKGEQTVSMDDFLYRGSMDCMEWTESGNMRSIVGTVVTFEWSMYAYCGGAHGWAESKVISVDLSKKGAETSLANVFGVASVKKALERSPEWKQSRKEGGMYGCVLLHEDNTAHGSFAFHHVTENSVNVSVGVAEHLSEACRGTLVELDLTLPIPARLADELKQADKEGTLMEDFVVEGC